MTQASGIVFLALVRVKDQAFLAQSINKDATDYEWKLIHESAKHLIERKARSGKSRNGSQRCWKEQVHCSRFDGSAYVVADIQGLAFVAGVRGDCQESLIWQMLEKFEAMMQLMPIDPAEPKAMMLAQLFKPMQELLATYNDQIASSNEECWTSSHMDWEMIGTESSPRFRLTGSSHSESSNSTVSSRGSSFKRLNSFAGYARNAFHM